MMPVMLTELYDELSKRVAKVIDKLFINSEAVLTVMQYSLFTTVIGY
jgi:hypothetical protein